MAIVTFWSNDKKETGKTTSIAAIATYMAIEHNYKILVISTIHNDITLETCYWEPKNNDLLKNVAENRKDITAGIDGLVSLANCNRLTSETVSNYTRLVFPDNRLEILPGSTETDEEEYRKIRETYKDVIKAANGFYDYVFVDLNRGLNKNYIREVLKISDLVVVNMKQDVNSLNTFKKIREDEELLKKNNVMFLLGKYDKYSKYNAKNISRTLGYRGKILTIPYCTLFFEACNEGKIVDFFLKNRKISATDRNAVFIEEVKQSTVAIEEMVKMLKNIY